MEKSIIIFGIALMMFLAACSQVGNAPCAEDAKLCPDGTAVGRTGPNCEFAKCPEPKGQNETQACDYSKKGFRYVAKNAEQCSVIKYRCSDGEEYFADECGCGCKLKESKDTGSGDSKLQAHDCTPEQRKAQMCTELYKPVCGWFDPQKIQCVKYPCAQTFSNSCFACMDEKVISWTEGECPK